MSVKGFSVNGGVQKYDATALDNFSSVLDTTLSQSAKAADAAAVGEGLAVIDIAMENEVTRAEAAEEALSASIDTLSNAFYALGLSVDDEGYVVQTIKEG